MPGSPDSAVDLQVADDPVAAFLRAEREQLALVLTTAGTGGRVRRSTASWRESFSAVSALSGIEVGSRVWAPGPARGSMSVFARVHAGAVGAELVTRAEDASHAVLTPTRLVHLLDRLDETDPPRLTTVVVAGDRLSVRVHDRAVRRGLAVHHYFGATELSFVAWGSHEEDLRAFPGVEVEVREREIWVRSAYLCEGYEGPGPGPLRRDADGFATVGDLGRLVQGRLRVQGRPDAVTTAGATVVLADVEAALAGATEGEVVVVGVPHERLGVVLAAVLTRPGDRRGVAARARAALPDAARPRLWLTVPALPLTPADKVDRLALTRLATTSRTRHLDD